MEYEVEGSRVDQKGLRERLCKKTVKHVNWTGNMLWIVVAEEADKGWLMITIGVSGWMFLLVLAYPGSPGKRAVKRLLLLLLLCCTPVSTHWLTPSVTDRPIMQHFAMTLFPSLSWQLHTDSRGIFSIMAVNIFCKWINNANIIIQVFFYDYLRSWIFHGSLFNSLIEHGNFLNTDISSDLILEAVTCLEAASMQFFSLGRRCQSYLHRVHTILPFII